MRFTDKLTRKKNTEQIYVTTRRRSATLWAHHFPFYYPKPFLGFRKQEKEYAKITERRRF
jgi:hypothetical protein